MPFWNKTRMVIHRVKKFAISVAVRFFQTLIGRYIGTAIPQAGFTPFYWVKPTLRCNESMICTYDLVYLACAAFE